MVCSTYQVLFFYFTAIDICCQQGINFAFSDHPDSVVCIDSVTTDPQCTDQASRYSECCECCRAGRLVAVQFGIISCISVINEAAFGPCLEIALDCCQQSELKTSIFRTELILTKEQI